jgi:hypothetical protein
LSEIDGLGHNLIKRGIRWMITAAPPEQPEPDILF